MRRYLWIAVLTAMVISTPALSQEPEARKAKKGGKDMKYRLQVRRARLELEERESELEFQREMRELEVREREAKLDFQQKKRKLELEKLRTGLERQRKDLERPRQVGPQKRRIGFERQRKDLERRRSARDVEPERWRMRPERARSVTPVAPQRRRRQPKWQPPRQVKPKKKPEAERGNPKHPASPARVGAHKELKPERGVPWHRKCHGFTGMRRKPMFMAICLVINILLAVWVYQDIRSRNTGSGIWIVITLLAGFFGALLYAVVRLGDIRKAES